MFDGGALLVGALIGAVVKQVGSSVVKRMFDQKDNLRKTTAAQCESIKKLVLDLSQKAERTLVSSTLSGGSKRDAHSEVRSDFKRLGIELAGLNGSLRELSHADIANSYLISFRQAGTGHLDSSTFEPVAYDSEQVNRVHVAAANLVSQLDRALRRLS